jgi:predicted CoA-binding protein
MNDHLPTAPASDETLRTLLLRARTIAIVGLSADPARPSHGVAAYLQAQGYRVLPVNPTVPEVLGQRSLARLEDIDEPVDIVNVFRRSADVLPFAQSTLALADRLRMGAFWQQLGVSNLAADALVRAAGLVSVMDRCIKIDHARLVGHG